MIKNLQNFFLLIILISFTNSSYSQWESIGPNEGTVNDLVKINKSTGETYLFAATSLGIARSLDNGKQWVPLYPPFGDNGVLCLAVEGTTLFAGTSSAGVYRSIDYGTTWTYINGISGYMVDIYELGPELVVQTDNGIYKSLDSGITFTDFSKGLSINGLMSMAYNGNDLFAGTIDNGILHSTDDGLNWIKINLPSNRLFWNLAFNDNYFFAGTDSGVYLSTDNGISWKYKGLPGIWAFGFTFKDSEIFLRSYQNGLFHSTDLGNTWNPINNGLPTGYISSLLYNNERLIASSASGIFISDNLGVNWCASNSGLSSANINILYSTGNYLLAGGHRYSDENNTWTSISKGLSRDIKSFAFDSYYLYAGSLDSGVFRSTDFGDNWTVNKNINAKVKAIAVCGNYLFTGDNFGIHRSSDNGDNWEQVISGLKIDEDIPYVVSLAVVDSTLFAGNDKDGLYHSTDFGNSWSFVRTGISSGGMFTDLSVSGNIIFAGVYEFGIVVSTDKGFSWNAANNGLPNYDYITDIVISDSLVFVSITRSGIYMSDNLGSNWIEISSGLPTKEINSVAVHKNYLYAATSGNGVFRIPLKDIITTVKESNPEVPKTFSLGQNYPNPFNPSTNIDFSIPHDAYVVLSVFNSIGEKIAVLYDQYLSAGSYKATWDASMYASGIYFFRLSAGNNIESKKMIFLK